jgi:hypothetical protein
VNGVALILTILAQIGVSAVPPAAGGEGLEPEQSSAPAPTHSGSPAGPLSVLFFAGRAAPTTFSHIIVRPWTTEFADLYVLAGAVSKRLGFVSDLTGSWGESFSLEVETGAGYRFGEEVRGEGWGALYLRFGHFPWNGRIHTTVATSLGLSVLTGDSHHERARDHRGEGAKLLHYFSPEMTFAAPRRKHVEVVLRVHHRSGVFGLFDGVVSGSNFVSVGVRRRL